MIEIVLRAIKTNLLGRKDIVKIKDEEDLDKYKEPPGMMKFKWEKKHYALICWVCICILASFLAALFVSIVGLTIIQSVMIKEEELCKKLELIDVSKQDRSEGNSTNGVNKNRRLRAVSVQEKNVENWGINTDSKGKVIPKIKILSEVEDENGNVTSLISMPCNSEVTDDGGNIWSLDGKYKLDCGEPHVFEYVLERMSTIANHCVQYKKRT
jgi:hypothetical protein